MKKRNILIIFLLILFSISTIGYVYSQTGQLGDVNVDGAIDIVDALLIAQHYVVLNPDNFDVNYANVNCDDAIDIIDALLVAQYYVKLIAVFPGCSQNLRTLTVEIEGKDPNVSNCDGLPIIDPPMTLITTATQFSYEQGTYVSAYSLGSTPPPPGIPWQSARFEYEGETANGFDFIMDTDKTIKVIFTTHENPAPTPVP